MWKARLLGTLLGIVLRVWWWTVRLEIRGAEHIEAAPVVPIALWHGRIHGSLYGFFRVERGQSVAAMFSNSPDGELAARALAVFGLGSVRGSTGKGGGQALEVMIRRVREGRLQYPALTVDGPRGPARRAKPGIVRLARALGAPVVPLSFSASRVWVLRSWDRTVLAKPFSRIVVEFGEPLRFDDPDEPMENALDRIGTALDALTDRLDREVHGRPIWD